MAPNPMSLRWIKMGDTGHSEWFDSTYSAAGWQQFTVDLNPLSDPLPFPQATTAIRFIITASPRYPTFRAFGGGSPSTGKQPFPVGMVLGYPPVQPEQGWPTTFTIRARNSDTTPNGGPASFMWLAIAENSGARDRGRISPVPRNLTFVGQPAPFAANNASPDDHQFFPNLWTPQALGSQPNDNFGLPYNFNGTFGPGPFANTADEPLVFATANNAGWVSQGEPQHNAAAVPVVGTTEAADITAEGFQLIARNSDTAAGSCGFNWVALKQLPVDSAVAPPDLLIDTGTPLDNNGDPVAFSFAQTGHNGDWVSAEIQFSGPFNIPPVVLITPRVPADDFLTQGYSCAPVAIAQNVTRFGFTLAARNSDTNQNVQVASFDWVAFEPPPVPQI
jgi:hypothetical protein